MSSPSLKPGEALVMGLDLIAGVFAGCSGDELATVETVLMCWELADLAASEEGDAVYVGRLRTHCSNALLSVGVPALNAAAAAATSTDRQSILEGLAARCMETAAAWRATPAFARYLMQLGATGDSAPAPIGLLH